MRGVAITSLAAELDHGAVVLPLTHSAATSVQHLDMTRFRPAGATHPQSSGSPSFSQPRVWSPSLCPSLQCVPLCVQEKENTSGAVFHFASTGSCSCTVLLFSYVIAVLPSGCRGGPRSAVRQRSPPDSLPDELYKSMQLSGFPASLALVF